MKIVAQDFGVVEAEVAPGDFALGEPAGLEGVVGALGVMARRNAAGVDSGDGVLARVATRVRIGEKLRDELYLEARLLFRLAPAGRADLLASVHEPARDGPAVRLVL